MKKVITFFVGCCLLCSVYCFGQKANGQVNDSVYQCDFEPSDSPSDPNELDYWEINYGRHGEGCPNKWFWGKPGANGGDNGLFVSSDGESNNYTANALTVVSYRSLNLLAGDYEISFDWQAAGWQDTITDIDGLYVCWVPDNEDDSTLIVSYNGPGLDPLVEKYALDFGRGTKKLSQSSWQTIVDTIKSDGTPHKLMFVWRNGNVGVYPPAACVDNILIMPVGYCHKPYDLNLQITDFNAVFSWKGDSESYDVRCYNSRTKKWKEYESVQGTSLVIEGVDEGYCTFYVRSHCGDISGTWVSMSQFVYYPGIRCIDYMGLSSENCFVGVNPVFKPGSTFSPGQIDKGYMNQESRHTIHYDVEERDPRTNGQLRTVPEGEAASVRLGNWLTGAEAERVEYKYTVDTNSSAVLILKYAVVLEDPDHGKKDQPKFELEILKGGKPIDDNGCGEAKFTAGENMLPSEGWHEFGGNGLGKGWWKDWTTISINLRDHHKEEVVVRLTTYDCAEQGHFAYAYFTLDCSRGEIESSACGDAQRDTLRGPDGFLYRWYKETEPDITLSEEQVYDIPTDKPDVYCLDVIQPTNAQCYYTLKTQGMQRYPTPDYDYELAIEKCENKVKFINKSYIATKNAKGEMSNSGLPCDVKWSFGDNATSSNANPVHIYDAKGGKYTVRLEASMNGKCEEIKEFEIELPDLTRLNDTAIYEKICPGGFYELGGKRYEESGDYTDTIVNEYGCKRITFLYLDILKDTTIYDTICSTDVRYIDGVQVTKSGKYSEKSVFGCDSIIWEILVNESLVLGVDSVISVCANDPNIVIPYLEKSGTLLQYDISFVDEKMKNVSAAGLVPENGAMVIPMKEGIEPNRYAATLSFGDLACGGDDINLFVDVYYPDSVIAQRWNDVLAVKDSMFNGGYKFTEYQWYKNNEPIDGATSSILYEELDITATYSIMLTREDGVKEMVCAINPIKLEFDEEKTVIVFTEQENIGVKTSEAAQARVWSSMGLLIATQNIQSGANNLCLNVEDGVYVLELIFEDGSRRIERIVIR